MVRDLYFTDLSWVVHYVVVDTGTWLPGRKVLLSADVLQQPDLNDRALRVDLTKYQVERSPGIETDEPVSRQHEVVLARYYGWPAYWAKRLSHGAEDALAAAHDADTSPDDRANPCLRSAGEVAGYHVQAKDGEIGHVEDFLIDSIKWEIRYVVVDIGNWWSGEKVLLAPTWFNKIDWLAQKVETALLRDAIRFCPPYGPAEVPPN
jgi:hypothetical protein